MVTTKNFGNLIYAQDNNATESIINKILEEKGLFSHYMESCGPTSICNAASAVSDVYAGVLNDFKKRFFSPEDAITVFLNDPYRYPELTKLYKSIENKKIDLNRYMVNRIPQLLGYAGKQLFGINYKFSYGLNEIIVKRLIQQNKAIIICYKSKHYVTIVGYEHNKFLVVDPWLSTTYFSENYKIDSQVFSIPVNELLNEQNMTCKIEVF